MIRVTRDVVRKWGTLLLHTHDTPRRTAAAFALGVCFACSPAVPAIVAGRTHLRLPHHPLRRPGRP